MNKIFRIVEVLLLMALVFAGVLALVWWRARELPLPQIAVAGRDGAQNRKHEIAKVKIGDVFQKFDVLSEEEKNQKFPDWNRFRGADATNVAQYDGALNFDLQNAKELWKIKLGEGYAAPVVWKNRVYILDYDEKDEADTLRCFSLKDGRELWRRSYKVKIRRNHGKSRTVACVDSGVVVSFGPMGQVMALDAENGDFLWGKDLPSEYACEIPQWYAGQCPIVDNGEVIIAPAGKDALLIGVDLKSGKVNWTVANTEKFKMSHSSIMKMNLLGKKQFIYCAEGGAVGVSAEVGDRGKILWSQSEWKPNVFAPSPVQITDSKIFLTAGYGAGGAVLELKNDADVWSAKIIKSWKAKAGAACEQQTPIVFKDRLFTILPKDAGGMNSLMAICDMQNDCAIISTSPRSTRFGIGPYMALQDKILVLDDNGKLYVLNIENDNLKIESSQKVLHGADSWGPMAFTGGLLLLRDSEEMICLDLRARQGENNE